MRSSGELRNRMLVVAAVLVLLLLPVRAIGEVMGVLYLDGTRAYVQLPSQVTTGKVGATVEAWVKWERFQKWARVFDFGKKGNAAVLQSEKATFTVNFSIYDRKSTLHRVQKPMAVEKGTWYHVAVVSGRGGMKFYLNGELVGQDAYTGSLAEVEGGTNYIGKSNWEGDAFFHGQMCEFRIWEKARTKSEILQTIYTQLKGDEAHLSAYWRFEAEDDRVVKDLTGNGNDAALNGGATVFKAPGPPIERVPLVEEAPPEPAPPVVAPPPEPAPVAAPPPGPSPEMMAYETVIRAALVDGVIQENERMMLESVRTSNQISEADAKMTERKLREELGIGPISQEEETYYSLLKTAFAELKTAFADGVLSESEGAMLQSMKTTLEVSDDREAVLKENVVRELGVPINANEETYYSLLKTAFADGVLEPV